MNVNRLASVAVHALSALAGLLVPVHLTLAQPLSLPNFDRRTEGVRGLPALDESRAQVVARLRQTLPGLRVDFDDVLISPRFIHNRGGHLTRGAVQARTLATGDTNELATLQEDTLKDDCPPLDFEAAKGRIAQFLDENTELFGYDSSILMTARVIRDYVTEHNGVRTIVWEQELDGIPIFNALLKSHVTRNGGLVNLSTLFVPDPKLAADRGAPNRLTTQVETAAAAAQAVAVAATAIEETWEQAEMQLVDETAKEGRPKWTFKAPMFKDEATASLIWLPWDRETMRVCWRVCGTGRTRDELYEVLVDAAASEALVRTCHTAYYRSGQYRVYGSDSPRPGTPGWETPLTDEPPIVGQVDLSSPATNVWSPHGWLHASQLKTIGNNVDARLDVYNQALPYYAAEVTGPEAARPIGALVGNELQFLFTVDPTENRDPLEQPAVATVNQKAAVVNAFYWCNWMHDRLYYLGFNEPAGNFQQANYTTSLGGGDAVLVDVQDGATDPNKRYGNNMSCQYEDGTVPLMKLQLADKATPVRDGALSPETILHEYTHGVNDRLVGTTIDFGLDEGWCDFYAQTLLSEATDNLARSFPMCGYLAKNWNDTRYSVQPVDANYYYGFLLFPYSTAFDKNPLTLRDLDLLQASQHAGVPHSPAYPADLNAFVNMCVKKEQLWAVTLMEMRANLAQKCGFPTATNLALQLVMDGQKACSLNPQTLIEARDALVGATLAYNNGAHAGEVWMAFARRGMGWSAEEEIVAGENFAEERVVEAFDLPPMVSAVVLAPNPELRNDFSGWVGFRFEQKTTMLVSELGRWVVSGNNRTHVVKLVQYDGSDLPGGSATVDSAGKPVGAFAYAALATPVTLTAGNIYYLVTHEVTGQDQWYNHPSCEITLVGAKARGAAWAADANPQTYVHDPYELPQSYGPVNLRWVPVSAPLVTEAVLNAPSRNDFTGWVGCQIEVGTAPLLVTDLGRWVQSGNSQSHEVKLVQANGTDLPGALVTVTTAGKPAGQFAYAPLASPVTLAAGAAYYLVSRETSSGDAWYDYWVCEVILNGLAKAKGLAWAYLNDNNYHPNTYYPRYVFGPAGLRCSVRRPVELVTEATPQASPLNNFTGWVGFQFQVGSSPMVVAELGRWVVAGNSASHTVKLVTSTGTDVTGGSVTVATAQQPEERFVYAPLAAPVTLAAGSTYYLVTGETSGGDSWYPGCQVISRRVAEAKGPATAPPEGPYTVATQYPQLSYGPVNLRFLEP